MIIEPDPVLKDAMLQALRDEYQTDAQRPGMHLSSVSYCLTKAYWERVEPQPPTETEVSLWSIGFALERVMIAKMHMEPLVVDGITMTPDFQLLGMPADLKSTRMAPTRSDGCAICGTPYRGHDRDALGHNYEPTSRPFDFPIGWQRQFMGYRYGLNTQQAEPAYDFGVVVMHVVPAQLTAWRVYFTHNELVENWQWVLQRASDLENMLAAQAPEPFQHLGFEGECTHCRFKLTCELTASLEKFKEPAND